MIVTVEWVLVAVLGWCAVAVVVGLLVGRAVRMRDRQVPRTDDPTPAPATDPVPERDQESDRR